MNSLPVAAAQLAYVGYHHLVAILWKWKNKRVIISWVEKKYMYNDKNWLRSLHNVAYTHGHKFYSYSLSFASAGEWNKPDRLWTVAEYEKMMTNTAREKPERTPSRAPP